MIRTVASTSILAAAGLLLALVSAPAAGAESVSWSGPYLGVQGGYGWRNLKLGASDELVYQVSSLYVPQRGVVVVPGTIVSVPAASASKGGWSYGGQLGYDFQLDRMVLGLEGDLAFGSQSVSLGYSQGLLSTALTPPTSVTVSRSARASLAWSVRARAGYAVSDSLLLYATGGLAGAKLRLKAEDSFFDPGGIAAPNTGGPNAPAACLQPGYNSVNCPGTADFGPSGPVVTQASQSKTQLGWTIGAGAEWRLNRRLGLGLEYRYTDLGHTAYSFPNATIVSQGATITDSRGDSGFSGQAVPRETPVKFSDSRLMLRLNWRFGAL